ncbi:hypothetical protein NMY22_g14981 [Coprinellus aureogranulatus]|nr:hypothetical protein NMY22_g14981 [Coprinellus aureogranulatus]
MRAGDFMTPRKPARNARKCTQLAYLASLWLYAAHACVHARFRTTLQKPDSHSFTFGSSPAWSVEPRSSWASNLEDHIHGLQQTKAQLGTRSLVDIGLRTGKRLQHDERDLEARREGKVKIRSRDADGRVYRLGKFKK